MTAIDKQRIVNAFARLPPLVVSLARALAIVSAFGFGGFVILGLAGARDIAGSVGIFSLVGTLAIFTEWFLRQD
jgi:hypothetical protein